MQFIAGRRRPPCTMAGPMSPPPQDPDARPPLTQHEQLLEQAPFPVCLTHRASLQILTANSAFARMARVEVAELKQNRWQEWNGNLLLGRIRQLWEELGGAQAAQSEITEPDGREFSLTCSAWNLPGAPPMIATAATELVGELRAARVRGRALLSALEAFPDLVLRLDRDGHFIEGLGGRGSGFPLPANPHGRQLWDLAPQPRRDATRKAFEAASAGTPAAVEFALPTQEGERCYEARLVPPSRSEVVAVVRDVTELRRTERELEHARALLEERVAQRTAELRRSEQSLRAVTDALPVLIFQLGSKGEVAVANRACEEWFGVPRDELSRRRLLDLVGAAAGWLEPPIRSALSGQAAAAQGELEKGDETRWVEIALVPDFDRDGRPAGAFALLQDVTPAQRAQRALRESEEKFRTFAESTSAAIMILRGGKLLYANPGMVGNTGYTSAELEAMPFWDLVHPDYQELVRARAAARERGESVPQNYEIKIRRKDGTEGWVNYSGTQVQFGGAPAVLGTAYDITAPRRPRTSWRSWRRRRRSSSPRSTSRPPWAPWPGCAPPGWRTGAPSISSNRMAGCAA